MTPTSAATRLDPLALAQAQMQALRRRHRLQWLFLALMLGLAAIASGFYAQSLRKAAFDAAARTLGEDADIAARISAANLNTVAGALHESVRLARAPATDTSVPDLSVQFDRIERMVPSLRTLTWLDAEGVALASNRRQVIGMDLSKRAYFTHARDENDPSVMHLSEPFRTALGVWSATLSVSLKAPDGSFAGVVAATLDPAHLRAGLSTVHRPGLELTLAHADGAVLVRFGQRPGNGNDAVRPDALASWEQEIATWLRAAHAPGATPASRLQNTADGRRLATARQVAMNGEHRADAGLLLMVSIGEATVLEEWQTKAQYLALALASLAAASIAGMAFSQRAERRAQERLQASHAAELAAEAQRRQQAALQAVAARAGRMAGWWIDGATWNCFWTDELRELLGLDADVPASSLAMLQVLDPDGRQGLAGRLQQTLESGAPLDAVIKLGTGAADSRHLRLVAEATRDASGRVASVEGAAVDVTASTATLAALRSNEALFRGVFDNAAAGIAVLEADASARRSNRRLAQMLGWTIDELDAMTAPELLHPDDLAADEPMWNAMTAGELDGFTREKRLRCKDGSWRWTRVALSAVRNAGARPLRIIAVVEDIAERKAAEAERRRLEAELRESQKMEAIGTLAGGIAHDFNNVLGVMLGNAETMRAVVAADPDASEALDQLFKAGLLGRELVQRVLAFARRQPGKRAPMDLREVVRDTAALLRSTVPAHIAIALDEPGDAVLIDGVAQQLQQVLLNLSTNAVQAIGNSPGTVTIRLLRLQARPDEPGRVRLQVADDGSGIDEAVQARIFEPFFTTKPVGQGTGLGLSMARSIVVEHGGTIGVQSRLGAGTTIEITLPCLTGVPAAEAAASPTVNAPVAPPRQGRGERVVYVDDNRMMGAAARRLLERAGYRVSFFASAAEALEAFANPSFEAHALVTDFSMPGLSGLELMERLPPGRRAMPVVLISGFVSDELRAEATRRGVAAVLRKEEAFRELAQAVGAALDRLEASAKAHAAAFDTP